MEAMEIVSRADARSANCGPMTEQFGLDFYQLGGDIRSLMAVTPATRSSFTALLELPANKAVELLIHSPEAIDTPTVPSPVPPSYSPLISLSDGNLRNRAAKFPAFPANSPESSLKPPRDTKQESSDSDTNRNSSPTVQKPSHKRKDKAQKTNESNKKNKKTADDETLAEDSGGEKPPLVHLRAPRGQATNSHSLAERARREKINARMKFLQEIVPGCEKISGTASVLDVIINHVQSLQSQVEFLSMRLAAVDPRIDFNLDNFLTPQNETPLEDYFPGTIMKSVSPEQSQQQLVHLNEFHHPNLNSNDEHSNFCSRNLSF